MSVPNQINDSREFRDRRNLAVTNANLFIANNNNPFLISPYSPPANLARQSQITDINALISSVEGNLATVIDLTTWTLRINNIINGPISNQVQIVAPDILLDAANDAVVEAVDIVRLSGNDINLNAVTNVNINGGTDINVNASRINMAGPVYFPQNTYFDNISTNTIFASNANISSFNVSTITVGNLTVKNMTVLSTLTASTTNTNKLSTGIGSIGLLDVTTLNASGNITFTTMTGSNISVSTMTVHSTLNVSSIDATGHITFQTMSGSSINVTNYGNFQTIGVHTGTVSSLTFSSIRMEPGTLSTPPSAFTSSIILHIGATRYKIPLEEI